jgi:hypothetical protein
VDRTAGNVVVRVEETSFEDNAGMLAYEEASKELFAAPHRQTQTPKYRLHGM